MKFLLFFLLFSHSMFAFSLKEKFQKAEAGTYVVTEQNEITSLLHLHTINENNLLFEEISIPSHLVHHTDWKEWAAKGSPGHTAWILYEVDISKNRITECYSLSRKAWIPTDEMESFFIPLLTLDLTYLSEEERIQSGPTPLPGQVSCRPWGPPQTISGKKVKNPEYDVYTAIWPHDHTDFSGKHIVLYFDKTQENFPFPFWMQAREGALKFRMRAIDSGTGMFSPITDIPRREPIFTGGIKQEDGIVSLSLNIPPYYDNFKLYAIDLTENPRLTHVIPFEIKQRKESATISIDEKKLSVVFSNNHEYLWILASEDSDVVVESPHLFKWTLEN